MKNILIFINLVLVMLASCKVYSKDLNPPIKIAKDSTEYNLGLASYYADKFEGRKTADGSIYSHSEFTAAHKTIPFGTKIKIVNPNNGKSIIVTVNDRGPFSKGKTFDLSKNAFKKLCNKSKNPGVLKLHYKIIK